jgi:predicted nucleotidyltransferase
MEISTLLAQNDELNDKFWVDGTLKQKFRLKLVDIAKEFYESLELPLDALKDITFTGSLANYNYTPVSDIDMHLIVDFGKIDSDNRFLVGEYFKAITSNWNRLHTIIMKSHEVEIYVQEAAEAHYSTGVYSLLSNKWITEPKIKDTEINKYLVNKKVASFMQMIEDVEELYDDKHYDIAHESAKKLMKKIKKYRSAGLSEEGEYSVENIAFKYLRNNNYIKLLIDMRNNSYDKLMSVDGDPEKKFKIYLEKGPAKMKTYNRLNELGRFQRKIQRDHARKKRSLIGRGRNWTPYFSKPNYRRSKSAPPGFGGS